MAKNKINIKTIGTKDWKECARVALDTSRQRGLANWRPFCTSGHLKGGQLVFFLLVFFVRVLEGEGAKNSSQRVGWMLSLDSVLWFSPAKKKRSETGQYRHTKKNWFFVVLLPFFFALCADTQRKRRPQQKIWKRIGRWG